LKALYWFAVLCATLLMIWVCSRTYEYEFFSEYDLKVLQNKYPEIEEGKYQEGGY